MNKPIEENVDSDSCNESEQGKASESQPAYMNALMRRQFLQQMVKSFPASLINRITALKNIQLEHLKLEAEFYEEVYLLEKKYHEKYQKFFDERKEIVTGEFDPPNEEPKWKAKEDDPKNEGDSYDFSRVIKKYPEDTKGIPNFWLTIFRNAELLSEMVETHDEPLLQKLLDIKIIYDNKHSYTLEFHFDKNEYFSNPVLTKQYFLKSTVDEEYPFGFEGPEIYKCKGCTINWEKKMNLTVKTIRKKQKHKERGSVRTIVKQIPNDSFFNFFNPPELPDDKEDFDEESQGILATDFEIGHFLRIRIIPKAILYYTGDIIDDEDDDDEEDEGEYDGEEEEEYNKSRVENFDSKKTGSKKKVPPNDCPNQ